MNLKEIANQSWPRFCEEFSRQHHGWLVSVSNIETKKTDAQKDIQKKIIFDQVIFYTLYLEGQTFVFEGRNNHAFRHRIELVNRFFLEETGADELIGLRLDSTNGLSTFIEFRVSALPESLDGLSESELS